MSRFALSTLVAVAIASRSAFAQPDPADPTPLTAKTYAYPSAIASVPLSLTALQPSPFLPC